jgi:hypothetical protein
LSVGLVAAGSGMFRALGSSKHGNKSSVSGEVEGFLGPEVITKDLLHVVGYLCPALRWADPHLRAEIEYCIGKTLEASQEGN